MRKIGYYEYKPGRWQVYFTHEGKQIHLTRALGGGEPLKSERDCQLLIDYIRRDGFDLERFGIHDKAFYFDNCAETWIKLSTCSPEWKLQRKQIANRFFIPYFKKGISELSRRFTLTSSGFSSRGKVIRLNM
jgi:hypothetical protein